MGQSEYRSSYWNEADSQVSQMGVVVLVAETHTAFSCIEDDPMPFQNQSAGYSDWNTLQYDFGLVSWTLYSRLLQVGVWNSENSWSIS